MGDRSAEPTETTAAPDRNHRAEIGGVLLAAGQSTRFQSGNKLLEDVDGIPMVRRAAQTAQESSLDAAVAIVGHDADAVRAALNGVDITVRQNDDYKDGQSTSVRLGAAFAESAGWDAAAFLLGDMPFVRPETVDTLCEAYTAGDGSIIVPRHNGTRGNPVVFGSEHFDTLQTVSGDRGGRELILEHDGTRFIDTEDPGVRRDIDSESDLREYTQ